VNGYAYILTERHDKPTEPEWRQLHRIMDRAEPKIRRAFLEAIAKTQSAVVLADVVRALDANDFATATAAVPWDTVGKRILNTKLMKILRDVFDEAGTVSARLVGDEFDFSVTDPRSLEVIRAKGGELIREISDTTLANVRGGLSSMIESGVNTQDAAQMIRSQIGLTERMGKAVTRHYDNLIEQGLTRRQALQGAATKSHELRQMRALMIARTEAAKAAHEGQAQSWEQAADQGVIDRDKARRVWVTTPDEHSDHDPPSCWDLDGQEVRLNEAFVISNKSIMRPPLHPNCRCSVALRAEG